MSISSKDISVAGQSDIKHHLHPYTQLRQLEKEGPLVIVRGEGVQVFDGWSLVRLAGIFREAAGRCGDPPNVDTPLLPLVFRQGSRSGSGIGRGHDQVGTRAYGTGTVRQLRL